jgi:hypothetical protein
MVDYAGNTFKDALLSMDRNTAGSNCGASGRTEDGRLRPSSPSFASYWRHRNEWERGDLSTQVYMSGVLCEELVARSVEHGSAGPSDKGPRMRSPSLKTDIRSETPRFVRSHPRATSTDYGSGTERGANCGARALKRRSMSC